MEFKIKKNDLLNVLRWSQGIAEKRGTMPILANLLLEVSQTELRVSATDLEIALVAETSAEIKSGGKSVINAKNLYEIIKEAPEEVIKIAKKGEQGIEIVSGKSHFRIVGMDPQEFPTLPHVSSREEMKIAAGDLEEMIWKTFYAASTDETRYTLNGLYFTKIPKGDKSALRIVATDGHRLSYDERDLEKVLGLPKGIIVPRKGIAELKNLISGHQGEIRVLVDDKAICFLRDKVTLTIRLIEGDFPAYDQVIPKKTDRIASVRREALIGALRRASIMTSEQSRGVKFSFGSNVLEVSSSHSDMGEATEEIAIDYNGASFQAGFNPRYFLDLLSVLEDEKIVLELKDEISPCVVRSEFDRGFLALIMPMRI